MLKTQKIVKGSKSINSRSTDDDLAESIRKRPRYENEGSKEDWQNWTQQNLCNAWETLSNYLRHRDKDAVAGTPASPQLTAQCEDALRTLLAALPKCADLSNLNLETLSLRLSEPRKFSSTGRSVQGAIKGNAVAVVEKIATPPIHEALVPGEVIENDAEKVVIRFNISGIREKREFYWEDLIVGRDKLPVGTQVLGRTQLEIVPDRSEELNDPKRLQAIREEVDRELKEQGLGSGSLNCRLIKASFPEPKPKAGAKKAKKKTPKNPRK